MERFGWLTINLGHQRQPHQFQKLVNLLLNKPAFGTYHFRTLKHTSWYDFAVYFINKCKIDSAVIPVSSAEFKTKAKRPKMGC